MKTFKLVLICLLTCAPICALADAQADALAGFLSWDKKLGNLTTAYEQTTSFEGVVISQTQGRLQKTGGSIRVESLENGKITNVAVTDKKIINIYDGKGKFVTALGWQEWYA
ncbi:MAG: hypothetical protein LBR90_01830, partial [Elusimicrobiota bacterium]|nr:hypothetical protein [Elusimicrobiota bacterium]